MAPEMPDTCTGVDRFVTVPSPSCPEVLRPQAHTVPSDLIAYDASDPAAMATTEVRPLTGTGDVRCVVVPSPNCPAVFAPQARTVPLVLSASVWLLPAA